MDQIPIRVEPLANHRQALPKIVSWVYAEWGHLMPDIPYPNLLSIFRERIFPHRIPTAFIALKGDEIVGTASLVENDLSTRSDLSPWLAAVYVIPEMRGMGVGTALVRAGIDEVEQLGLTRFYLITPDRASFYARIGWVKLEQTEYRGETVSIMAYEFCDQ
jgi:N-acetylglutamate synthase-like GNAT family acetyltransferase